MKGRIKFIFICLISLLCLILIIFLNLDFFIPNYQNSVIFFNVGQGDAALIRFDNGQKMLVDCGVNRKILSKLGSALPFFDRTIDYLVVTHPDGDHYGGCPAVLQRYRVKNIITNGAEKSNDQYWLAWQKYQSAEKAQTKIISGRENLIIGSSRLEFLAPDNALGVDFDRSGGNNHSIVFLLKNSLGKFLFTGDMEVPLEKALINKYCLSTMHKTSLKSDYLKVGHHGSDSSSGEDFLQFVNPKYAIISVGQNNYGHPSLRTLRKLDRAGATIWRTDQLDDIIIK